LQQLLLVSLVVLFTSFSSSVCAVGAVTDHRPPVEESFCFGDEVTIDFSNSKNPPLVSQQQQQHPQHPPPVLIYTLQHGTSLPPGLVLGRRTGIVTGVLRDAGFQNKYNITVIGTDPTDSSTPYDRLHRSTALVTSTWCTGARISRFFLIHPNHPKQLTRIIQDGDTIPLKCNSGGTNTTLCGGFTVEVETFCEFSREAQSEGDLTARVDFILDQTLVRTEREFPYSLGGKDNSNARNALLEFPISHGQHTLTATPYNPSGQEGFAKTITFWIVNKKEGGGGGDATTTH
jgi:hypothetical protein